MTTKIRGTGPWYAAAALATGVSVDTSWRFFGEVLHITVPLERVALFAVLEVMLIAGGYSMHHSVKRNGAPGSARLVVWGLAGVSAYMAVEMSGPLEGLARVVLGPVLAIVALHQALGIAIRTIHGARSGTWARIGREMRERALSRLNLGDDNRDAKVRSAERAAVKAATIATSAKPNRKALRAAVLKSGAATDARTRTLMLSTAAALKSLDKLVDMDMDNPWTDKVDEVVPVPSVPRPRTAPTSGGPAIGWDLDKVVAMLLRDEDVTGLASPKDIQRTKRVLAALAAGKDMAAIVRGDITAKRAADITAAYMKAMTA